MRPSVRSKEVLHVGSIHAAFVDSPLSMLRLPLADLSFRFAGPEAPRTADRRGGALRHRIGLHDSTALQLRHPVPSAAVPAEPAEDRRHCLGVSCGTCRARHRQLAVCLPAQAWSYRHRHYVELLLVGFGVWPFWLHCLRWLSVDMGWFLH